MMNAEIKIGMKVTFEDDISLAARAATVIAEAPAQFQDAKYQGASDAGKCFVVMPEEPKGRREQKEIAAYGGALKYAHELKAI